MSVIVARVWVAAVVVGLSACQAGAEELQKKEIGVPLLSRIPYLNRLFKNVGAVECEEAACQAKQVVAPRYFHLRGPDGVERIGIDFDIQLTGAEEACAKGECPVCPPLKLPHDVEEATAGEPCLGDLISGVMEAVGGQAATEAILEAREELHQVLEDARAEFAERERELLDQLTEARIEAATTKAKLKAQKHLAKKEAELRTELLAAQIENAKLAAKLEMAAEKEQLAAELRKAQFELVTLKSQSEFAALKKELLESAKAVTDSAREPSKTVR